MDLDVYGLCLGGNVFGWTADRDASFAVLDAYVEAGGNFIDTADTYMRPNLGISETIIGEWMAARGNRDALVIATKVGSDGGLSAANIASHVDGVPGAAGDRPHRSLLRPQGRRLGAGRGDRARVRRAGARRARSCTSRCPTRPVSGWRSRWSSPSARGWRRYEWLQPHYNLVERAGYEAEFAPVVERFGLAVAPYYALASGFLTGKYRGERQRRQPARREGASGYLDARGERVLAALDSVAAEHEVPVAAVAIAWLLAKPGVDVADRQRADARAARGRPPRRGARPSPPTKLTRLDEASA